MSKALNITVVGAGQGGPAMVAHLMSMGFEATLYELPAFAHNLKPFIKRGGIRCSGEVKGFFKSKMTTNAKEAGSNADLVMVAAKAMGHETIVKNLLPHMKDGSLIAFHTGCFAGLHFYPRFARLKKHVMLAETDFLPYAAIRSGPHSIRLTAIKKELGVGTMPATDTRKAVKVLNTTKILRFRPRKHSVASSLASLNMLYHPPFILLNLAAAENAKDGFYYYRDGISAGVGKVIHAMDAERLAVARKLGAKLPDCVTSMKTWYGAYNVKGKRIDEIILSNPAYSKFCTRSIQEFSIFHEDLLYGLAPTIELGRLLRVPTPMFKMLMNIANLVLETDYMKSGLTLGKLGIAGMTPRKLLRYLQTGRR